MKLVCAVLLSASPICAVASCLVAADLEGGIAFDVEGGDREIFKPFAPSVIQSTYQAREGFESRALLARGVYLIELIHTLDGEFDPTTRSTFTFPLTPSEMPEPAQFLDWDAKVVMLEDGEVDASKQRHVFGAIEDINFGECHYAMIPVELHLNTEDKAVDVLHYLPTLGISYLAASTYGTGETRQTDRYVYFRIEAVE